MIHAVTGNLGEKVIVDYYDHSPNFIMHVDTLMAKKTYYYMNENRPSGVLVTNCEGIVLIKEYKYSEWMWNNI